MEYPLGLGCIDHNIYRPKLLGLAGPHRLDLKANHFIVLNLSFLFCSYSFNGDHRILDKQGIQLLSLTVLHQGNCIPKYDPKCLVQNHFIILFLINAKVVFFI